MGELKHGMDEGGGEAAAAAGSEALVPTDFALAFLILALALGGALRELATIVCFSSFMVSPT